MQINYEELREKYASKYGKTETRLFSSPGRVEICGNHTDHNNGKVIVSAINCETVAVVGLNNSNIISISSEGYDDFSVDIDKCNENFVSSSASQSITAGIVTGFLQRNYFVSGFNATINSNVFKGAGVSSSASFELLICVILNALFNKNKIKTFELVKISQYSENKFLNKPCGLLDQSGIGFGGLTFIDFSTNPPVFKKLPKMFDEYQMFLINTGDSHEHLTSHYAEIKEDMFSVASFFNKKTLGEISYNELKNNLVELKKIVSGRAILRAIHFYEENERVSKIVDLSDEKDETKYLQLIEESGNSSWKYLQNLYTPNDKNQCVPLCIALCKQVEKDCFVRVHGGGFGGTVLCFVPIEKKDNFKTKMIEFYSEQNVFECSIRETGACEL